MQCFQEEQIGRCYVTRSRVPRFRARVPASVPLAVSKQLKMQAVTVARGPLKFNPGVRVRNQLGKGSLHCRYPATRTTFRGKTCSMAFPSG